MFGLPMADDLQTLIDDASFDFATGDAEGGEPGVDVVGQGV